MLTQLKTYIIQPTQHRYYYWTSLNSVYAIGFTSDLMTISKTTNNCMSRKSWPVLYIVLLCIDGQTFMGIQWGWTRYGRISWMASRLFRILHWKTYIRRKQTKYLILRVVLAFHSTPYFWFWFFFKQDIRPRLWAIYPVHSNYEPCPVQPARILSLWTVF